MKIVINRAHSYFGLSKIAVEKLVKLGFRVSKRELKTGNIINEMAEIIENGEFGKDYSSYDEYMLNECLHPEMINIEQLRMDSRLIKVIEKLGNKANSENSNLKIVEIPDNVEFYIKGTTDNCCSEYIEEKHRIWY